MRILIAEDDTFSLSILSQMLGSTRRYEVVQSRNGTEAWAELERGGEFDLCIFDIMMPEVDGLTLVKRMRDDPRFREQRIMFCTALNERSIIAQAAALGVSHYIVKPFFKEHVLKQVSRICEEGAAVVHFEPASLVADRLGLTEANIAGFLGDLHRDVSALVGIFQADARAGAAELTMRVNSLKGAALNLGAKSLAAQLAALEDCCTGRARNSLDPVIAAVEAECQRLRRKLSPAPAPAAVPA